MPVSELPKVNSARIHSENRVYIHPVHALGKDRYSCYPGWRIVGWANAPYKSLNGSEAIVYERLWPRNLEGGIEDSYNHLERGLYWGHGNAATMSFQVKSDQAIDHDEEDPWIWGG